MGPVLFVVFVVLPIAEIALLIAVGHVIGLGWTVLLLLLSAVVGSWLVRREGRRAWNAFSTALAAGRPPAREVADGALVLTGGVLMVVPGFLTDVIGLLCLLPPTRSFMRRLLTARLTRRMLGTSVRTVRSRRGPGRPYDPPGPAPSGTRVIDGEVER
jgi:UPF0716 protein FxsA